MALRYFDFVELHIFEFCRSFEPSWNLDFCTVSSLAIVICVTWVLFFYNEHKVFFYEK